MTRRVLALLFGLASACFYRPSGSSDSKGGSSTTGAGSSSTDPPATATTGAPTSTSTSSTSTTTSTGTASDSTSTTTTTTTGTTTTTTTGDPDTTTTTTETTSSTSSGEPDPGTTAMPEPMCGNGVAEMGETCDGTDLGGKACTDFPHYGGGILKCNANCLALDFSSCCRLAGQSCNSGGQCCSGSCVLFSCS